MEAPLPNNEADRLMALGTYQILDTEPEMSFDDLTHLAAQICQAPIALVSFVDQNRQWFKSRVGLELLGLLLSVPTPFCNLICLLLKMRF
jgi:hypothetical protein